MRRLILVIAAFLLSAPVLAQQYDAEGRLLVNGKPWVLGQSTMALSMPVTLASNQSSLTITGTVTANAGTNLNTSLLALEAGGNLAIIAGAIRAEDSGHVSGHTGFPAWAVRNEGNTDFSGDDGDYIPIAADAKGHLFIHTPVAVSGTFWQTTQPVSIEQTGNNNAVDVLTMPSLTIGTFPDNEPFNLAQVGGTALTGADVVDGGNTAFRVNCVAGCVAGGSFADSTAFSFGSTAVGNTAFVVDDAGTNTVAENSAGAGRMSTNRIPYFSLHTDAGVAVPFPAALAAGGGLKVEGVAGGVAVPVSGTFWPTTAGSPGSFRLSDGSAFYDGAKTGQLPAALVGARLDTNVGAWLGSTAPSVGQKTMANSVPVTLASDQTALSVVNNGAAATALRVTLANDSTGILATVGTVTNITNLPNEGQQTAANSISVTPDTDNDAVGATGAAPPGEVVDVGGRTSGADTTGLMTGLTVCTEHVAVDIVTATTTLVITGVTARHVRICSINLVTQAANNVALVAGTGATCGTSTAGINGGVTAAEGWNFAANGGLTQGGGLGEIMSTKVAGGATGDSVCIITSAATQLSGTIAYAIY